VYLFKTSRIYGHASMLDCNKARLNTFFYMHYSFFICTKRELDIIAQSFATSGSSKVNGGKVVICLCLGLILQLCVYV